MVNKTSRTFNYIFPKLFLTSDQIRVIWNMVPSNPPCCPSIQPASDVLGFDEANSKSRKNVGLENGGDNLNKKNVERVRSPELRSKLILLNNLVSINSDIAERMLSVISIILF